jgi:phage tail sheath protein FI
MALFITSTSTANRHAAYAIERAAPAVVKATGTFTAALVEQFPWGPVGSLIKPGSISERLSTLAPAGMSRTGSGYLAQAAKGWPLLYAVRVLGPTAITATSSLTQSAAAKLTVTAKYPGVGANSFISTVSAPSDGVTGHFNLDVSVTGATGTTTDSFKNLNVSGTGSDVLPTSYANTRLVGLVAKVAAGTPDNATYVFSAGTDGTITSAEYVGTAGTGDKGLSLLEGDATIRHVFTGDPGNSLRAAVNAGLVAHATYLGERCAYINGPSGQTLAQAQTDVATYRSKRVVYVDPWCYILDDTTGAKQLVPAAAFAASVASQLSPSTSIAWKNAEVVTGMLGGIVDLEFDRGQGAGTNTDAGICTLIREQNGGFSFEAGVITNAPADPTTKRHTRTRMGDYIAYSITQSWRGNVDAPNVPANQQALVMSVDSFMDPLKRAASNDPNHSPHVLDYSISNLQAANAQSDIDNGDYTIPLNAKTSAGQERIFLSFAFGESVKITAT